MEFLPGRSEHLRKASLNRAMAVPATPERLKSLLKREERLPG
jgi:hypothetical protein